MNDSNHADREWQPCAPGTLTGIAASVRARRRRRTAWLAAGTLCSVVLVGVLSYMIWKPGQREFNFGGIACSEVRANMVDYRMQRLPPDVSRRIALHMEQCPSCQEYMKRMQAQQAAAHRAARSFPCDCPSCRQRTELAMLTARFSTSQSGISDSDPRRTADVEHLSLRPSGE